jgi:hypothetical protein
MCVSWFSPCFVLRRVPALLARVQRTPALKLCVGDAETTILAVGRPSVPEAAVRIEEEVAHAAADLHQGYFTTLSVPCLHIGPVAAVEMGDKLGSALAGRCFAEALAERGQRAREGFGRREADEPDHRQRRLLRQMASQGLSLLAGALVSFFVTRFFTPEAFESWAWRIPFLMGLLIGPVGIFIRRYLNETRLYALEWSSRR